MVEFGELLHNRSARRICHIIWIRWNHLHGWFPGGGQIGYNYQAGQWVFGIEGTWDWTDMKGHFPLTSIEAVELSDDGTSVIAHSNPASRLIGRSYMPAAAELGPMRKTT